MSERHTGLANRYEEVNRLVCDNEQQMAYTFADLIKRGQEQGEIGGDRDARTLSSYLFASLQGLRVLAVTNSDVTLLRQVKDTYIVSRVFRVELPKGFVLAEHFPSRSSPFCARCPSGTVR